MGETSMQGNENAGRGYTIENRELIAESAGLRVQTLTIGPGQCVPWHHHTRIADTFFCLEGPMVVHTRERDFELAAGEQCAVAPGEAHMVEGKDGGPCRFAIVQGVGEYDFVAGKQDVATKER
jgi:mannose-6-phosphate isomerase-like protein (cupin superfamily)